MNTIPVFLVLILTRYTKIPRIDEIGHNLIDVEKALIELMWMLVFIKLLRYHFSTATSQRQQLIVIVRS